MIFCIRITLVTRGIVSALWMIKGIWPLCSHIYNHVEQEVMAGQFHAPSHPGVLKKNVNMNGNILQRYFTHKNF